MTCVVSASDVGERSRRKRDGRRAPRIFLGRTPRERTRGRPAAIPLSEVFAPSSPPRSGLTLKSGSGLPTKDAIAQRRPRRGERLLRASSGARLVRTLIGMVDRRRRRLPLVPSVLLALARSSAEEACPGAVSPAITRGAKKIATMSSSFPCPTRAPGGRGVKGPWVVEVDLVTASSRRRRWVGRRPAGYLPRRHRRAGLQSIDYNNSSA